MREKYENTLPLDTPCQPRRNVLLRGRHRTSLLTSNEDEARQLVEARNNSHRQPTLNLQLARAYLTATDPAYMNRTWQNVMDEIQTHGKESTQIRYVRGTTFPLLARIRDLASVIELID